MLLQAPQTVGLRRELGRWDLTAIGVNQVIGSAVFVQPAMLAALVGGWSPLMVVAGGVASLLIALSFAEVASRFDATGGPYLYTRPAFGRFAAFEVGWLMWFSRVTSWAAVTHVLASSLGFYWSTLNAGPARAVLLTSVVAVVAGINIRGIRQSSHVVNALTIGKVLPLLVFAGVGLFFVAPSQLIPDRAPALSALSAAGLALVFAFGGYEVVSIPAGEARDPRSAIPFALVSTILIVTVIMTLVQLVVLGTLPDAAASRTPLADASLRFLGGAGAALMTVGAVLSTSGNNMGAALAGPRHLFALAEQSDLPRFFGKIHSRFRTPSNAILVTSGVALVLALSGSFEKLALVSGVSRLAVYAVTCASTLRLRDPRYASRVAPARFVVPFGPIIPSAAIVIAVVILAGARNEQLSAAGVAVAAGAVLYVIAARPSARLPRS